MDLWLFFSTLIHISWCSVGQLSNCKKEKVVTIVEQNVKMNWPRKITWFDEPIGSAFRYLDYTFEIPWGPLMPFVIKRKIDRGKSLQVLGIFL